MRLRDSRLADPRSSGARRGIRRVATRTGVQVGIVACVSAAWLVAPGLDSSASPDARHEVRASAPVYPVGTWDPIEPSFLAPPKPSAMAGYTRTYVNDFVPLTLSSQWDRFTGVPRSNPSGRFEPSHVQLANGMLEVGTWRDPKYDNKWATGGVCLCGIHTTYGAFFVRSRQTTIGPDDAELLWPANNTWPPEVDFNETGNQKTASSWFDHYNPPPSAFWFKSYGINVEHWHTWGVVWTPTSITFVVDGHARGKVVTAAVGIPTQALTLDLESETWCGIYPECPKVNSELLIDWVAIFTPTKS
jgi:hypothetical protein